MYRLVAVLVICCLFSGTYEQKPNVEDLISNIFKDSTVQPKNPAIPTTPSTTPDPSGCVCVPYYLCNNDSRINTNGVGIIDIRIDEQTGPCQSYLDFCCLPPDIRDVKEPIIPVTPDPPLGGCGRRNPDGVGFRTKGDNHDEAKFGEFPWMVAILSEIREDNSDLVLNVYQCGGSLITPQVVVTAAHCVANKEKHFKIRAGEWDTQTTKEIFPHEDRNVKSITLHPQYYAGALHNDIAVLILESPLDMKHNNIDVACLPTQGTVIPDGTRCFASGWGKDVFGKDGKYQVILKKIDLPIVGRNKCQNNLRTTRLGKYFELHKSFICAGGEPGKDTCKGDGGSPLVCPIPGHPDRYQHVGIVAWGIGCGENQIPGVYANVAEFRDWINEQVAYNNLDTKAYEY